MQGKMLGIGDLVLRHQPGAERAGADKVLAGRDLLRMLLIVADRAVVENRVAGDVVERVSLRDVAAALADDDREFAFPIEIIRHFRTHDGVAVRNRRAPDAQEYRRKLRDFALHPMGDRLLVMVHVIAHDANDLLGARNYRQQFDSGQLKARLHACEECVAPLEIVRAEEVRESRMRSKRLAKVSEVLVADHGAPAFPTLSEKRYEFHRSVLPDAPRGPFSGVFTTFSKTTQAMRELLGGQRWFTVGEALTGQKR